MINFFCNCYSLISRDNKILKKLKIYALYRIITRYIANQLLPIYLRLTSNNDKYRLQETTKKSGRVVVSFTSFPARINKVWMVVETILRQTVKPDMITLWLSIKQFPSLNSLPDSLLELQERGLVIGLIDEDYRSHNKYYYAMEQYPNDIVITIDDDIIYESYMIEKLLDTHRKYPMNVIANNTRSITFDNNNKLMSYKKFSTIKEDIDKHVFQLGVGGVLYPPHVMYKDLLIPHIFMEKCKFADDMWLYAMCRLNNTNIKSTNAVISHLSITFQNDIKLSSVNVGENLNDVQINNIRNYYIDKLSIDPFGY